MEEFVCSDNDSVIAGLDYFDDDEDGLFVE